MRPIIFIVGPTATGKSEVAYLLARGLQSEIISCDSMLVYREPAIITAKPKVSTLQEVPHHFISIISVTEDYNVYTYYKDAGTVIQRLLDKGTTPVVCGGTGLYMKALCDGIFEGPGKDEQVRRSLKERIRREGLGALYRQLCRIDPEAAARISPADERRIIRALEVYYTSGVPISQKHKNAQGLCADFPIKIFGLVFKRDALYERINQRVDTMFQEGAVEEVSRLRKLPLSLTARKIIGIPEISRYLDGEISTDEARELMKKNTRNFAKRQMTWFRGDKRVEWIDIGGRSSEEVSGVILGKVEADTRGTKRG